MKAKASPRGILAAAALAASVGFIGAQAGPVFASGVPAAGNPKPAATKPKTPKPWAVTDLASGQALSSALDDLPHARNSEDRLQPNTVRLLRLMEKTFPYYASEGAIYGWRLDPIPDHPSGQALDIMIRGGAHSKEDVAEGSNIAAFLMANSRELGVTYLIWRQHIWDSARGWSLMGDRGGWTANHMDHVHVLVKGDFVPTGRLISPIDLKTSDGLPTTEDIRRAHEQRIAELTGVATAAHKVLTKAEAELARVMKDSQQRQVGVADTQRRSDSMAREAYMFGADLGLASMAVGWFAEPEALGMISLVTDHENQARKDDYEKAQSSLAAASRQVAVAKAKLDAAQQSAAAADQDVTDAKDSWLLK